MYERPAYSTLETTLGALDWSLAPAYLIFGAPAWALGLLYVAFRLLPKKGKVKTSSVTVSSARIIVIGLALALIGIFAYFVLTFDPH
jgi:hypothetical membrane protein